MASTKAPLTKAGKYPAPPKTLTPASVAKYLNQLRQQLAADHSNMASYVAQQAGQGAAADLPPAGCQGRVYFAVDTLTLYYDTGALWHHVQFQF